MDCYENIHFGNITKSFRYFVIFILTFIVSCFSHLLGLRLFCDRLVEEDDRNWCHDKIDEVARKWFAGVDFDSALKRPIFYTTWLSKETRKVEREELKQFLAARLKVSHGLLSI